MTEISQIISEVDAQCMDEQSWEPFDRAVKNALKQAGVAHFSHDIDTELYWNTVADLLVDALVNRISKPAPWKEGK